MVRAVLWCCGVVWCGAQGKRGNGDERWMILVEGRRGRGKEWEAREGTRRNTKQCRRNRNREELGEGKREAVVHVKCDSGGREGRKGEKGGKGELLMTRCWVEHTKGHRTDW